MFNAALKNIYGFIARMITPRFRYVNAVDEIRARLILAVNFTAFCTAVLIIVTFPLLTYNRPSSTLSYLIISTTLMGSSLLSGLLVNSGRLNGAAVVGMITFALICIRSLEAGIGSSYMLTAAVFLIFGAMCFGWRGIVVTLVSILLMMALTINRQVSGILVPVATNTIPQIPALFFGNIVIISALGLMLGVFVASTRRALLSATRLFTRVRALSDVIGSLTTIQDVNVLTARAADIIRDRFAVYAVQLYLIDTDQRLAVLRATTDENARALQSRGYTLSLTTDDPVAQAIANRKPRLAERDPSLSASDMLNEARTQLVLPLIVNDRVIGAVDIRSTRPSAFTSEEVDSYGLVATQLATAIHNAQQYEIQRNALNEARRQAFDTELRLKETQQINQRLISASYQEFSQSRQNQTVGYTLDGVDIKPESAWTNALEQAVRQGKVIVQPQGDKRVYALPVSLRDNVIGAIEVEIDAGTSEGEVSELLQAIAARLAVSVDNARLFEQTQRAAERERKVNAIAAALDQQVDVAGILETAVVELGRALRVPATSIRLKNETDSSVNSMSSSARGATGKLQPQTPVNGNVEGSAHEPVNGNVTIDSAVNGTTIAVQPNHTN